MNFRIRPADKLFSLYLREKRNRTCEYCGRRYGKNEKGLTVSHFYGRKAESTRFDEENCQVLCWLPCHSNFEQNPAEYDTWMQSRMTPQGYKLLVLRAHTYQKRDDKKVLIWLKAVAPHLMKEKPNKQEKCVHNGHEFVRDQCMAHLRKRKVKKVKHDNSISRD